MPNQRSDPSPLPPSADVTTSSHAQDQNPWTRCYAHFRPSRNPKTDVHSLGRMCGRTAGMRPITEVRTEYQRERDPAHRYLFTVPEAGSCYRVFAAGDESIQDLDLLLRGPDGENLSADLTHDAWPVLPPRSDLCFASAGLYMLEVSVFRGAGYYAVQVWGG